MRLAQLLLISTFMLPVSGCGTQPILTPSELNAHAAQYDGKRVRVRGWLVIGVEEYAFWDSKKAYDGVSVVPGQFPNECVSYLGPIDHRTAEKVAVLDGTFWKDFATSLNAIDLGTCNISGLDVDNEAPAVQRKSN